MPTKKERIGTWIVLAIMVILLGVSMEIPAEVYFPKSWFHTISVFILASAALLGILGFFLAMVSLAWNDWQESKNTKTFVSIGDNDRVISVNKLDEAVVHLPVSGTSHQTILAPRSGEMPRITNSSIEHIHVSNKLPDVLPMDDELYNQLFGFHNNKKE